MDHGLGKCRLNGFLKAAGNGLGPAQATEVSSQGFFENLRTPSPQVQPGFFGQTQQQIGNRMIGQHAGIQHQRKIGSHAGAVPSGLSEA